MSCKRKYRYEHVSSLCPFGCRSPGSAVPVYGQSRGDAFAIENVRVFNGVQVILHASVLVESGKVTAIGQDVLIPDTVARIDGSGHTLLPGLIDAHVHTLGDRVALTDAARFGATTVLEMLADPESMRALHSVKKADPSCAEADYFSSGAGATVAGGHGHFSDAYPTISNPEAADAFVRARIDEGSQYIKLFIERGFPGRPRPTLDAATVQAVIRAAHRYERLAVVHATRADDVRMAIDAGADGLVHLWQGGADEAMLRLAATRRVFVIPTLTMIESMIDAEGSASLLRDSSLAPYLSERAKESVEATRAGRLASDRQAFFQVVQQLKEAGVPILPVRMRQIQALTTE